MAVESRAGKMAKVMSMGEGGSLEKMKSWPQRAKDFYQQVRTEMKKVTTPSRKEVQATTIVVIITVFIFGAYFGIIDTIIGKGIGAILNHFAHR